jgi:histidine ammonia-lyase
MGMHAARKTVDILDNLAHVLAIELLCAVQALDLRAPLRPAPATAAVRDLLRQQVPFWHADRLMCDDIAAAHGLIRSGQVVRATAAVCGPLF